MRNLAARAPLYEVDRHLPRNARRDHFPIIGTVGIERRDDAHCTVGGDIGRKRGIVDMRGSLIASVTREHNGSHDEQQ